MNQPTTGSTDVPRSRSDTATDWLISLKVCPCRSTGWEASSGRLLVLLSALAARMLRQRRAVHPARCRSPPDHRTATASGSGKVTFVGPSSFTIQTGGRRMGMLNALTASANRSPPRTTRTFGAGVTAQPAFASVGTTWRGNSLTRLGYDCSGAVAAVLAGAGLWPAGTPVPNDAGVISYLLAGD